jgi:hypothetical protein
MSESDGKYDVKVHSEEILSKVWELINQIPFGRSLVDEEELDKAIEEFGRLRFLEGMSEAFKQESHLRNWEGKRAEGPLLGKGYNE